MKKIKKIIFSHDGLAFYPSMLASKKFFSELGYVVEERLNSDFSDGEDLEGAVLWLMMGFYPKVKTKNHSAIIHEYRSLSLGRYRHIKDFLKKTLNHKPSYRIFQSIKIKNIFNKNDGVPYGILPLGVSKDIINCRVSLAHEENLFDFCYVGSISKERRIDRMISSFISAYGNKKTLILVGTVCDGIEKLFYKNKNIIFSGRVSQKNVYEFVNKSNFSISYVPNVLPYSEQPPTKLYEYASLGRKIIVNQSESNINAMKNYGINAFVMQSENFPTVEELASISGNNDFEASHLFFDKFIISSGIVDFLERRVFC